MNDILRAQLRGYTWNSISEGDSGASVFHLTGRSPELFVKTAPVTSHLAMDLAGEAERLEGLLDRGLPAPRLVEVDRSDDSTWLVTEALPGRSLAERWPRDQRSAAVESVAQLARTLHSLPVDDCPFDRRIPAALAAAEENVRKDRVDLEDLEEVHAGWTGDQLLSELDRTRLREEDLVVCHGDLSPNNVLLDVDTCRVVGLLDVGRLGVADRYADLALMVRGLRCREDPWFGPTYVQQFTNAYGLEELDCRKVAFFTLLDELF